MKVTKNFHKDKWETKLKSPQRSGRKKNEIMRLEDVMQIIGDNIPIRIVPVEHNDKVSEPFRDKNDANFQAFIRRNEPVCIVKLPEPNLYLMNDEFILYCEHLEI